MVKALKSIGLLVLSTVLLSGCHQLNQMGEYERTGTVIGTVGGGIIGAQFGHGGGHLVGAAIGGTLGGIIGNVVGQTFDSADATYASQAFYDASRNPVGQGVSWSNSRTGSYGSYTPVGDGHSSCGHYCREYYMTAYVDGCRKRLYGTACRHPNGTWYRY